MIIYKITNLVNGKVYIGQTYHTLKGRWVKHLSAATHGGDSCVHKALRKYGVENFSMEEVVSCENRDTANFLEILFIHVFDSLVPKGYNLTEGGYGGLPSLETRVKMSLSHLGKITPEEVKRKQSSSSKGKPKSEEHSANISKGRKGIKFSEEHIANLRASHLGKKQSEEQKRKKGESLRKYHNERKSRNPAER